MFPGSDTINVLRHVSDYEHCNK